MTSSFEGQPLKTRLFQTKRRYMCVYIIIITPRKTNMSPENQSLEDAFPIEIVLPGDMLIFRGAYV